eukprot:9497525-Pyramimonas_sp.AAC.1
MAHPLLLGLALLRYNRAGTWLRLRRSCWLGLPTSFKLTHPPSGGRGIKGEGFPFESITALLGFFSR